MKPAPFDYVAPATLDDAIGALATAGDDAKILAGGQSLIPMLALRLARPAVLVDINRLRGLDGIREASGILEIGALVRQRALERWAAGRSPLFAEVLRRGRRTRRSAIAARWWAISSTRIPPRSCPRCSSASRAWWSRAGPGASA